MNSFKKLLAADNICPMCDNKVDPEALKEVI